MGKLIIFSQNKEYLMKKKSYFDVSMCSTYKRDIFNEPNLTGSENKRKNSKLMKKESLFRGIKI